VATQQRWTYKVVKVKPGFLGMNPDAVAAELDKHGALGWELVSATQPHPMHAVILYLKRPT